jgi:hypothetical protein
LEGFAKARKKIKRKKGKNKRFCTRKMKRAKKNPLAVTAGKGAKMPIKLEYGNGDV